MPARKLKQQVADYRDLLDVSDHDLERAHAEAEGFLCQLLALLDLYDVNGAIRLIEEKIEAEGCGQ